MLLYQIEAPRLIAYHDKASKRRAARTVRRALALRRSTALQRPIDDGSRSKPLLLRDQLEAGDERFDLGEVKVTAGGKFFL